MIILKFIIHSNLFIEDSSYSKHEALLVCFSITIFVLFMFLLISVCKGCWEAYAEVIGIWRKEDNWREFGSLFALYRPWKWNAVIRLDEKCPYTVRSPWFQLKLI